MNKMHLPLTSEYVQRQNKYALSKINATFALADKLLNDPKKAERLKDYECVYCFYSGSGALAGQAFTKYSCGHCGKEEHYSNTRVPKYCETCAKDHNACVRCGSSLELEVYNDKYSFLKK